MNSKNIREKFAVSEIVGTILLLGIATCCFSILYFNVVNSPTPNPAPIVEISGMIEDNQVILTHHGGESLDLDTKILLSYKGIDLNLIIGDYLDNVSKSNGLWDLGEKLYFPIYEEFDYVTYPDINIGLVDDNSNTLVFAGKLDYTPTCDMSVDINVNNSFPKENEKVNFTITVTNNCYLNSSGTIVEFILPQGFTYISSIESQGSYNNTTGLWNTGSIEAQKNAILVVEVTIGRFIYQPDPTQLVLILDGSGSISSSSWNLMKQGISAAIDNDGYFPHDGTSELIVIQFGSNSNPRARLEVSPTIVTDSNVNSIKNTINNMAQLGGYTPMSCGVYLAGDTVKGSSFFNSSKRQIFLLVTDGVPNCERILGAYNGVYRGNGWSRYSNQKHSGSYSAGTSSSNWGDLICNDLNTKNATSITLDFWYRLTNTESDDLELYFYNGTSYNLIASLGDGTKNQWLHYTNTIADSQYFISNFKIRFSSQPEIFENVWIDDIVVQTDNILLSDGFENIIWNVNWGNSGQKDTEEAISYLVNTLLQMSDNDDEFNCLAVDFTEGDTPWLKEKVVWPQPGYYVPPFIEESHLGWVRNVSSWNDFAYVLYQSLGTIFNSKVPVESSIKSSTYKDLKIINNKINTLISIVPSFS
jgi:uncharacterized repeat protein (TIGR01451 family)